MHSPYGLEVNDSCLECKVRSPDHFCNFEADLLKSFEVLKYATVFPKGAVLFVEGPVAARRISCFAPGGLSSQRVQWTAKP